MRILVSNFLVRDARGFFYKKFQSSEMTSTEFGLYKQPFYPPDYL
jgi:hypothetical protein